MASVKDLDFSDVDLLVLVDRVEGGWNAEVSEGFTGSSTDDGGDTFGELLNNVFAWAGISGFEFGVDDSVDDVRSAVKRWNDEANELGIDFTVRIYTGFGIV